MFGPMRSEPVNLPSWGLRAGYESSSFIDSIFPPSFSYLGMEQGPCLIFFCFFWRCKGSVCGKGRADCKYIVM